MGFPSIFSLYQQLVQAGCVEESVLVNKGGLDVVGSLVFFQNIGVKGFCIV